MVSYKKNMAVNNKRTITIETGTILKILGIFLVLYFLYLVRDVLALIFSALFLAALIHPAARYLATKKIPKGLTVISVYLLLFAAAVLIFGLLLPPLIEQSSSLFGSLGKSWQVLSSSVSSLKDFSMKYGLSDNVQAGVQSLENQIFHAANGLFSTLTDVFGGIVGLIVVLVMAFYMVVQEDEARNMFHHFVPEEYQEISATILKSVEEKIGRWFIGQLALCLIIGVLYYIGLTAIGMQSSLVLAIFGGFTEFIPYLGPILGAIPVILLALSDSPVKAVLALIIIIVIQQLENHIIVPKVMQRALGINPLVSILALIVGGKLFGFIGVLLAIPVATSIAAILSELYKYMKAQKHSA